MARVLAMALSILLCVLSLRILPVHGNALKTYYTNSLKFPQLKFKMSEEEPFITLYNFAVKDCVYECTVRSACAAVNYWNVRRQCDLLEDDTSILYDSPPGRPCVYIRMSDVRESPDMPLSSLCQVPCDHNQVCDVEAGNCTISECRALNQPGISNITGNILSVGSLIRVSCKQWFVPDNYTYLRCQGDGNWNVTTPCVFMFECGYPPDHVNAVASTDTYEGNNHVVVYECLSGYAASQGYNNMTIPCVPGYANNNMWEKKGFACIRNCSEPPEMENATMSVGDTLEGTTRNYTCNPGLVVNGTGPMATTCQPNGTWTTLDFRCHPAPGCPLGWDQIGSSCYIVPDYPTNIGTGQILVSKAFCGTRFPDYDTYMVQLETPEEDVAVNGFLQAYSSSSHFCIGLHEPNRDGVWVWMETNEPVAYSAWCPTEPDGGQYYAAKRQSCSLGWRDIDTTTCQPVCEISLL